MRAKYYLSVRKMISLERLVRNNRVLNIPGVVGKENACLEPSQSALRRFEIFGGVGERARADWSKPHAPQKFLQQLFTTSYTRGQF